MPKPENSMTTMRTSAVSILVSGMKPAIGALFLAAGLSHAPQPAHADLRICNDTTSMIGVALGYRKEGTWVSEGWWQVPGETCASLIEGDLANRYYYLYAEDADRGGQWRGEVAMCVSDSEFRIEGIDECFSRGLNRSGFFEVDTDDKESWMVRLTEQGRTGGAQ